MRAVSLFALGLISIIILGCGAVAPLKLEPVAIAPPRAGQTAPLVVGWAGIDDSAWRSTPRPGEYDFSEPPALWMDEAIFRALADAAVFREVKRGQEGVDAVLAGEIVSFSAGPATARPVGKGRGGIALTLSLTTPDRGRVIWAHTARYREEKDLATRGAVREIMARALTQVVTTQLDRLAASPELAGYVRELVAQGIAAADRNPPKLKLEKPAARRTTVDKPMVLLAALARDDVGMDRVEVILNGVEVLNLRIRAVSAPVLEIPVHKALVLQEGENRVELKAVDTAGNAAVEKLVITYRPR